MAQTSYTGYMATPSGHRLVMQSGTHAFTTSATVATLTLKFKRPVAVTVTPGMTGGKSKSAMIAGYIPYVSATLYTQTPSKKLIVSRATGSVSALKFVYQAIGY